MIGLAISYLPAEFSFTAGSFVFSHVGFSEKNIRKMAQILFNFHILLGVVFSWPPSSKGTITRQEWNGQKYNETSMEY